MSRPLFPLWVDRCKPLFAAVAFLVPMYVVGMVYYATPIVTSSKGYSPVQPVAFSHAVHAGQLAMDCRYCHTTVDRAAFAAVPPTATCMNCHARIAPDSIKMITVKESQATGNSITWQKIHDLPDFVYFDHSAHVNRGVGCVSCHGRIDRMEQVYQAEPLTMSWCLDCHRNPDPHLRPLDRITDLAWQPDDAAAHAAMAARLRRELDINPSTDCSTCHR